MSNVQLLLGLLLLFVGVVWFVLAFGKSIVERRVAAADVAANLDLARRRTNSGRHAVAVFHRDGITVPGTGAHSDRYADSAA